MNNKDALNTLNLKADASEEDIKLAYRKACSLYHPDRNPAGLEMMKIVNAAYDSLKDYTAVECIDSDSTNYGEAINNALNSIINFGLEIEVCGAWIWVSGDTKPFREQLKAANFKWAPKKMMWHFRPADYKSFSRGKYNMDEIRSMHGSAIIKNKTYARLSV